MIKIKNAAELCGIFLTGAFGYCTIELLWRGYTHLTMFFAGGICFFCFYVSEIYFNSLSLFHRCVYGGVLITSVEFVFGCVFNILLEMEVWDYSDQAFNVMGQVCLKYFVLWVLLCVPLTWLSKVLREKMRL